MRTEGELRLVADAAAPDPDVDPDLPLPTVPLDARADAVSPPRLDVEAGARLERQALEAALVHLERRKRAAARHPERSRPPWADLGLFEARYCVIDLETTGTGATDEILEVGAVRVADGEQTLELGTLVQPWRGMAPRAQAVHGIDLADVVEAPRLESVLPALLELAHGCVLVFHNASFDLSYLQRALRDSEREPFAAPVLDTLVMARRLVAGRCGLGTVSARLGIPGPHLHRALPDARLTAKLLVAFLQILHDAGVRHLGDVPGVRSARRFAAQPSRRERRRGLAPPDSLARRLCAAAERGEALQVALRIGGGAAPLELHVRPLQVQSQRCLALDLDRRQPIEIELDRIERLAPCD